MTKVDGYRELSSEYLHSLISYDRENGKLYWRERPASIFNTCAHMTAQQKANAWNGKFAGKPAIDCEDGNGYLTGMILGHMVLAHRVVYCMENGSWPDVIDHSDGEKTNNRHDNIKDVGTIAQNMKNLPLRKDNKSGVTGVSLDKRRGTWIVHAKGKHVGSFKDYDDAVNARIVANEDMGFHKNHGRDIHGRLS